MVEKRKLFLYSFFFKNCTSLGPNWSILLGSWKGQIEKKFQSRIHRGQFRFLRGRNGTCPTRFGSNSPKRTLMGQIGPREIGANLAFGVNLALFILQCIQSLTEGRCNCIWLGNTFLFYLWDFWVFVIGGCSFALSKCCKLCFDSPVKYNYLLELVFLYSHRRQ